MKFNIFLGKEYEHTHEREIFERFAQDLYDKWETEATGILLGNVSIGGVEIDAIVLKSDCVILIDFKAKGGNIIFSENGPWIHEDGKEIKGGNSTNPFNQIRKNKRRVMDFLKDYSELFINNKPNWGHIKGFIISHEEINVINADKIPGTIKSWFKIMSYSESFAAINNAATPEIELSENELEKLKNTIGYSKEIQPKNFKKDELHDENMLDALLKLYVIRKKHELYKVIESVKPFEIGSSITRDETRTLLLTKNKDSEKLSKFTLDNLDTEFQNVRKEIEYYKELPIDSICNSSTDELLKYINLITGKEITEENIQYQYLNEVIKFIIPYSLGIEKYSEEVYTYVIKYFIRNADKSKIIPLLNTLGRYIEKFYSSETITTTESQINIGFNVKGIERIILNFKSNCDIPFFDIKYDVFNKCEYYYGYVVPSKLVDIQHNILNAISKCFSKVDDYELFIGFTGLEFLKKEKISIKHLYLIENNHNHIFNIKKSLNLIGFLFQMKYRLYHLELFNQIKRSSKSEEYGIMPNMLTIKTEYDDEIDNVIRGLESIKEKKFKRPQDVNFEYKRMKDKYFTGNTGKWLEKLELCPAALELSNDKNSVIKLSEYGRGVVATINTMYISDKLYDKLMNAFVIKEENIILKENNNSKGTGNHEIITIEATREKLESILKKAEPVPTKVIESEKEFLFGYDDIKAFIRKHLKSIQDPKIKELIKIGNPDGIILYGPPGCGKTYFAQWIAKELNFEFNEVPKSKFSSPYVDGGLIELTKVLDEIKKKKNQVVFFDEFDSVAIKRNKGNIHNESLKIVNSLLQEIPKIIESGNLVIAATNYLENLDDAVIRSGRFGLKIPIFPPLANERAFILKNLVFNLINDEVEFKPYVEFKIAAETDWWINQTKDMYLYSNSDLVSLAHKILTYFTETFRNEKEYSIEALNAIKGSKPNCKALLDFLTEIEENIPEGLEKRFEEFANELAKKGCIKNGKNNKSVGYKYKKND